MFVQTLGLAILLAALSDGLFWNKPAGISVAVYAVAAFAALMISARWRQARAPWAWILPALPLALHAAWTGGPLTYALLALLLFVASADAAYPGLNRIRLFAQALWCMAGGWLALPRESAGRWRARGDSGRLPFSSGELIVPLLLVALFGGLLFSANLALGALTGELWRQFQAHFADFSFSRILFWGTLVTVAYGFLLARHPLPDPRLDLTSSPLSDEEVRQQDRKVILSLALLNALFLAHNISDGLFLWMGRPLPPSASYRDFSEFARHGAYLLITVVLLAAGFLCAFFRLRPGYPHPSLSKRLALAWILQNLFVTASAARRLGFIIEAYGLSRMRVYTWIWLALVISGFVLLALKILLEHPFSVLFRRNLTAAFLALYVSAFLPVDAWIARWNVAMHQAGKGIVDFPYLWTLGDEAYPWYLPLQDSTHEPLSADAREHIQARKAQIEEDLRSGWPAWTKTRESTLIALTTSSR